MRNRLGPWATSMGGLRSTVILLAAFLASCGSTSTTTSTGDPGDAAADVSNGAADSASPIVIAEDAASSDSGVGVVQPGNGCSVATDCQSLTCAGGVCGSACISDNAACTADGSCCGGKCASGVCSALNKSCKTGGNACAGNEQCCSHLCQGGTCLLGSSFCIQTGDACVHPADCCGGTCNIAAGGALGTCGAPPSGPSFCSGGVDGTVCGGCNDCCSRLCAPYGPAGVKVCQRANGCHIDGDLCRKDTDCCGGAGSKAPGDGNVVCVISAGSAVGICRNPTGCNPEGNVCHYKNYSCSISSARNDCCGAPGNSGACQLDALGVPRCHAIDKCVEAGGSCAFTGDCCSGAPCVPDATGALRCLVSAPDGGRACVAPGASCTVTADCCRGYTCLTAIGALQGTCGMVQPPRYPDGGPPAYDGGPAGACAEYGQACTSGADCCNAVACTTGICYTPVN